MRKIVGFLGSAGHGKDTAAEALVEIGFIQISFARALYQEVASAFGVSVNFLQNRTSKEAATPRLALAYCKDNGFINCVRNESISAHDSFPQIMFCERSPREILQLWGTEYRRNCFSKHYWTDQVAKVLQDNFDKSFVISDVRHPQEVDVVLEHGGELIRVVRPGIAITQSGHSSEVALKDQEVSLTMLNQEGNPDAMRQMLRQIYSGNKKPIKKASATLSL